VTVTVDGGFTDNGNVEVDDTGGRSVCAGTEAVVDGGWGTSQTRG